MAPIDVRTGIAADVPAAIALYDQAVRWLAEQLSLPAVPGGREGAALTRRIQEKNIYPERAVASRQRHRIRRGLE